MTNSICTAGEFSAAMLVTFPKFSIDIAHFADCSKQVSGALIYAIDVQKFAKFLRGSGYNAPRISDKEAGSMLAFNDWLYNQCKKIAGYLKGYIIQKDSDKITFGIFELPPFEGFNLPPFEGFNLPPFEGFILPPFEGFNSPDVTPFKTPDYIDNFKTVLADKDRAVKNKTRKK